jgi:hypothetical protein
LCVALLAGCAGTERVTDFSDRSVGYGWLDLSGVGANRLHSVVVYQLRPQIDKPYYHVKVKKFEGGYLYYSFAFPAGAFKTYSADGQQCLGPMCTNTTYTYNFGKQGDDVGAVLIEQPGVYHFGSYQLDKVKTGLFEQGKFDVTVPDDAPSQQAMLQEILKDAEDVDPIIAARIEDALAGQYAAR